MIKTYAPETKKDIEQVIDVFRDYIQLSPHFELVWSHKMGCYFLLLNRDRHGANIEVLRNTKKRTIRLAPIFDHGLSLLFNCHDEDAVRSFDVMQDKQIQCFVGSRSTQENLKLIPGSELPALRPLRSSDREFILGGIDPVLPKLWQDRIWEMIERRWQYYESFCNQRRTGSIAD